MLRRTLALSLSAALGVFSLRSTPSAAQLGHVVKAQKISATSGGFSAQLDEMDQFGRSIVNLGDLDGDGLTDLLVGAHTDDDGGTDKGSVYVLFLHQNGFVKAWQKISDLEGNFGGRLDRNDQFGRAAANLGDLDGDGVVDVAVSSNYDDDGGTNKGAVYVLFLNPDGTVKASQKISETTGGLPVALDLHDEFGRSITALGDLDGDGNTELLVGTPEDDEGGSNAGALHVLFLRADGTVRDYRRISKFSSDLAIKPGDWFGFCSTNLGDFDGDGVTDVAVGAVLDDDGGVNQGSVWILCLNADGTVKTASEIDELEGGFTALDDIDQFGTSVVNLGDLDGDGVTDIAVGAVKDDDGGPPNDPDADVGAVYVLFLNVDRTVKHWVKLSDQSGGLPYPLDSYDWFGSGLARLGGSSGDGLFNVAIGCRNDDDAGGNQGAIYVVQLNDGTAPVADFRSTATLGIAPLAVTFTDASAGLVTGWVWNFGEGNQSNLASPTKVYANPGTYDVQLTARGPTGVDSLVKHDWITVVAGPLAAFDASPRTGPCPLSVGFSDHSLGTVTSWLWDFGDGTTSTEPAPQHLYAECGTYTVTLTVTGPDGSHAATEPGYVQVALLPPTSAFLATGTLGPAPLDVQFQDESSGPITSWLWDFGDGMSSSEPSPLHRYETLGSYTVTLTTSGPGGSDTSIQTDLVTVTVPPPLAYFEATPTLGPEPLPVAFTDATTGAVSAWSWDFGDGASASVPNPVHVYSAPGTYDVTLTATGPGGNHARTRPALIVVEAAPPGAAFSATPTSGPAPLAVQFTDLSTLSVTSWSWDFGDGESSNERHPQHAYSTPGRYSVTLQVSGPAGSDSLTWSDLVDVQVPATVADFVAATTSGAVPLSVAFTDLSGPTVSAWAWDFGDGASTSEAQPTHTYAQVGLYDVTLVATGPGGSDTRVRTGYIEVREPAPVALFQLAPALGAAPLFVQFDDQSSGPITSWSWDFGDGASSREAEPSHTYEVPGTYGVSLTVTGPGGSDTLTRTDAIQVELPPVVASFGGGPTTGVAPLAVQFNDSSSGVVTSWSWDFGDGSGSSLADPSHDYATPGTFSVSLTVSGPGGSDSATRIDWIVVSEAAPVTGLDAAPTSGVAPLVVQFSDLSSGAVTSWSWDFGDGSGSSLADPAHTYLASGTYGVSLTVTGPGGTDSATQTDWVVVQHAPPVADFSAAPREGYAPLRSTFQDLSTGAITSWAWDFDDGGFSNLANPTHTFEGSGSYAVELRVTGPGGSATRLRTVVVRPAPAFADGGFEAQAAGSAPIDPWDVYLGNGILVRPTLGATDQGFPSEGSKWCDLGAQGSSSAIPPSNPFGPGAAPLGTVGIQQAFLFPLDAPHLFFEAAFLLDGDPGSATRNDFMSVDITDGLATWNLFHADTFSEFPLVSSQHGLPMTAPRRVAVDLAELFPTATEATLLSLRVSMGNVGGATRPSRGYVDGFRFALSATASFRNGSGLNPAFYSCSPAVLGGDWTLDLDTGVLPSARWVIVGGREQALAGVPILGGEVLIGGPLLFSLLYVPSGGVDRHVVPIPEDLSLLGRTLSTQAVLGGRGYRLSNAYDLRMGY